ncbi:NUDIX domain-containing protein [Pseudoalteromonas sp. 2CM39R]|uniref:NUDIX hydrolase n=1 Tax=Pseudoalteromonas sp. 2CM39R TaxID=2929856 RepID=UPI0020BE7217|nr:NUDIX domain-containing protein [Pseudoalteromonas sp. 2CM39R]MCK8123583.1 NUDIX domain-containing protein [Pseudoalteromonas sp. 2CM39R]
MAFSDTYRLSSHAVITNNQGQVLLLKADYGQKSWGLPGGSLDKGETIHQALLRECQEELNCDVDIAYLSGVYYHTAFNSHAFIFRAYIAEDAEIMLSNEHTEYSYFDIDELSKVQKERVLDCLNFTNDVVSKVF